MTVFGTRWWRENGAQWFREREGGPAYAAQEAAIVDVLRTLTDIDSILEVGCGDGRITRYLLEEFPHSDILATDVATADPGKLFDLDAPRNYYPRDLVVAAEVLMHRPPDRIADDVELLCRMATRYVLTVDWREDSDRYAAGCYQHPYLGLFGYHGIVTETPVLAARQSVFLTTIERGDKHG